MKREKEKCFIQDKADWLTCPCLILVPSFNSLKEDGILESKNAAIMTPSYGPELWVNRKQRHLDEILLVGFATLTGLSAGVLLTYQPRTLARAILYMEGHK